MLVSQIVAGKYVDLSELLAVNLLQKESEPQLLFDGHLVLMSQPKNEHQKIKDITSRLEAFPSLRRLWSRMEGPPTIPASHHLYVPPFFGTSLSMLLPLTWLTGRAWMYNCSISMLQVRPSRNQFWHNQRSPKEPPGSYLRHLFASNGTRGATQLYYPPMDCIILCYLRDRTTSWPFLCVVLELRRKWSNPSWTEALPVVTPLSSARSQVRGAPQN